MPSSTLGSETKQLLSAITQGDCPPEAFPVGYDTVDEVKLHCRVGMDFFFFFFLVLLLRGECSAMSLSILLLLLVFSAHLRPRPLCFVLVSVWFVLFFSFTVSINTIFVTISPPSHTHLTIPAITEIAELLKSNYIFLMTSSPKNGN